MKPELQEILLCSWFGFESLKHAHQFKSRGTGRVG
jgi:hypothetical protein